MPTRSHTAAAVAFVVVDDLTSAHCLSLARVSEKGTTRTLQVISRCLLQVGKRTKKMQSGFQDIASSTKYSTTTNKKRHRHMLILIHGIPTDARYSYTGYRPKHPPASELLVLLLATALLSGVLSVSNATIDIHDYSYHTVHPVCSAAGAH